MIMPEGQPPPARGQLMISESGEDLLVYDPARDEVFALNGTARIVFEMARQGLAAAAIEAVLRERFSAEPDRDVRADVEACLKELAEKGLLPGPASSLDP